MMSITIFFAVLMLWLVFSSFAANMLAASTHADTSLPKIRFFSVKPSGEKNIIAWEAETDLPTVYYEVQKSEDSIQFNTIAMVLGPKPTNNNRNYFEFGDKPFKQKTRMYYRVKQVNAAGEIFYTGIIKSADQDYK